MMPTVAICAVTIIVIVIWKWMRHVLRHPLVGRCVLITGCDTGLGRAIALHLHHKGAKVIATCLSEEGRRSLERDSRRSSSHHSAVSSLPIPTLLLDVSDDASVAACVERVHEVAPDGIDVLLNNAATISNSSLVALTPLTAFQRIMDVNLMGTIRMCKALIPSMTYRAQTLKHKQQRGDKKSPGVRIINVSSFMGRTSLFSQSAYCASKFALEGFIDALRQELYGFGVDVILLQPGVMRTQLGEEMVKGLYRGLEDADPSVRAMYGESYARAISRTSFIFNLLSRDVSASMNDIEHAITARFPKSRYVIGFDSWLLGSFLPRLPSGVVDLATLIYLGWPKPDWTSIPSTSTSAATSTITREGAEEGADAEVEGEFETETETETDMDAAADSEGNVDGD